jgi:hypothetical protein
MIKVTYYLAANGENILLCTVCAREAGYSERQIATPNGLSQQPCHVCQLTADQIKHDQPRGPWARLLNKEYTR